MNLPCIDCITLAMCKSKTERGASRAAIDAAKKCCLLNDYLDVADFSDIKNSSRQHGKTLLSNLQSQRIIETIAFLKPRMEKNDERNPKSNLRKG